MLANAEVAKQAYVMEVDNYLNPRPTNVYLYGAEGKVFTNWGVSLKQALYLAND